jgi:hypothetical protein
MLPKSLNDLAVPLGKMRIEGDFGERVKTSELPSHNRPNIGTQNSPGAEDP